MRRHHDMGGLDAGLIDRAEGDQAAWEKKVDAILRLLRAKEVMTLDELRRGIEAIGPDAYDRMSYYQRWMTSITDILLEKQLLTPAELGAAMAEIRRRHAAAAL